MNIKNLGKEVLHLRKSLNLTQNQLCEGVCTQPTISMIEKGQILPSLDTIYYLSIRLKKPLNHFLDILFTDDYQHVSQLVMYVEELTSQHKYEVVYELVNKEVLKKDGDPWLDHFLKWQFQLCSYKLRKINFKTAISNLKELINEEYQTILIKDFLKERIYNTIAFIYAMNKDYRSALFYYNKIQLNSQINFSPRLQSEVYFLRVLYNKSKTLYDMNDYQGSISTINQGIDRSIKLENMSFMGHFYYYLGQCYEKTAVSSLRISRCFQKAEFFFDLLNKEMYLQILHKEKGKYLKDSTDQPLSL